MVKKTEIVKRRGSEVHLVRRDDPASNTCIGEICYNAHTDKIEVELKGGSCSPDYLKGIAEKIWSGRQVEFIMPSGGLKDEEV